MEGYLKVTPEQLMKAASEFAAAGNAIRGVTSEMLQQIGSMKGIWQGEAADTYYNRFMGLSDDMERLNRMIEEHVNDLNEMARNYQQAEEAGMEAGASLVQDVVS